MSGLRSEGIERVLRALLARDLGHPATRIGKDFGFKTDPYIRLERVGGPATVLEATYVVDIEAWASTFRAAESLALNIEQALLGYSGGVDVEGRKVILDEVSQNVGPAELPWEADSVSRLGATYVITIRRS